MWGAKRSLSLLTSSASYLVYATIVSKMGAMLVLRKGLNPLIYIPHHVAMHSLRQCTHMTTRLTTPWLDACFRARQAEAKAHVQPSSVLWVVSVEGDDGDTLCRCNVNRGNSQNSMCCWHLMEGCSSLLSAPLQLCCPHLLRDDNGLSSLQLPS